MSHSMPSKKGQTSAYATQPGVWRPSEEQPGNRCGAHGRVDLLANGEVAGFRPISHVANLGEGCADACGGGRCAFP
jgi:hypothetical protein